MCTAALRSSPKSWRRRQLAACKTLANRNDMQLFEYRSVSYWSKEINGTLTGGQKWNFFNSRPRAPYGLWRPRRLNPVNPRRRGVPGVAQGPYYTRASAYAACAAASSIFGRFLSADHGAIATFGRGLLPGLSENIRLPHRWRMRHRQLPTTRLTPRDLQGPIHPRKKCALGPMAPRPR